MPTTAKKEPEFRLDDMIRAAGHIPLRLPAYHCELNPIERVSYDY